MSTSQTDVQVDGQTPVRAGGAAAAVDRAKAEGRAALVAYLPVGFPDVEGSVEAAKAAVAGGADVVELGFPYSDPTMDGPTIQRAAEVCLANRTRPADVLRAVEAVAATGAAVLVMTYWPPVDRYGVDRWAADLASAGGAGLITPDLIPDEAGAWIAASDAHDLERVFLVAPSSTDARLATTSAACRGFVYAASLMGVTGTRASVGAGAADLVRRTRAAGAERVCVGLGVSTPAQATEVAGYADGVIVGSAFVQRLLDADSIGAGAKAVGELAEALAVGVRTRP
ncbi:tryptophan synthase alpha chain [Kineococcus rhizosphaerae]|uniref:Tryptophan synthase alpha chain n=1 Tax=Kineococcus rhizosphaerae TaxID=559628 RepID=A0A2T0R9X7_9ACTN|nr:tryptophan synthase subunit alpha [Kineococcus rhizosphaerae]PRY17972.1 tryptophan synthase alpha chain [Kineococcus rhizosphaerae]